MERPNYSQLSSDYERLIEDLRQYQFELQQQNEELRRAYSELESANRKFRDLWDNAPVGYVRHDRYGRIYEANRRALRKLGIEGTPGKHATIHQYLDLRSQQVFRQHLLCASASHRPVSAELRLAGDGEIWFRVETARNTGSDYRTAIVNISAQRKAELERLDLARQLMQAQRLELLNEMSGGIAHEFNNLLQVICMYAGLVREEVANCGGEMTYVDRLANGIQKAARLTDRMLAFGRQSSLQSVTCDLRETIAEAVRLAEQTISESIEIEYCPQSQPVPATVDQGMLEQALLNLLVNARDAMPDGGKITASTELRSVGEMRQVVIRIQDDGAGMSDDVRERIFEPFFTTKSRGAGTGLGLAIVYGIVKQHDGSITVDSLPGRGACFEIVLPAAEAPLAAEMAIDESMAPMSGSGRVLLAEDEPEIRQVLAAALRHAGYEVMTAGSGEEAIAMFEQAGAENVDLVLTDVVMPRGNGKALCEHVHKCRVDLPVVFLTGYGDAVIDLNFVKTHQAVVLSKPITSVQLLQAIQRLVPQVSSGIVSDRNASSLQD
ncbi:MAG: response regulator [Planctomycetales bacterium]|nr:response regulator [Planctomycetales bacterium]